MFVIDGVLTPLTIVNYTPIEMGCFSPKQKSEFWACPPARRPSLEIYPGPWLSFFKPCHSLSARLAAYHSAWFLCHVRKHHRCYIILPSIGRGTTIYLSDTIHPPVRTGVLWKSYNSSYNSTFNKILNIKKVVLLIVASQEIMCSCSRNHLSG
jgi:hypothetical protein